MIKIRLSAILAWAILLPVFLTGVSCKTRTEEVNVYSGRHYQADEQLYREFTAQTGIKVNLIKADTDQLVNRIRLEGSTSPADLLITADAVRLAEAAEAGLLQPIESDIIQQKVPAAYRDVAGRWTGLTKRARVMVYHKERISPSELSTYEDLSHPRWKGRILVRSSNSHYNQTLMASMVAANGTESAEVWARSLVENMARPPQGNDRDQVKALAAGLGDIAIVNTYYIGLLLNSSNEEERLVASRCGIFFPNQQNRGAHINISGMGIAAAAPNKKNAIRLIEYLLSDPSQQFLAAENHEYPVSVSVEWPPLLASWGTFREDTIPMNALISHLRESMFIFDRAGWK